MENSIWVLFKSLWANEYTELIIAQATFASVSHH